MITLSANSYKYNKYRLVPLYRELNTWNEVCKKNDKPLDLVL